MDEDRIVGGDRADAVLSVISAKLVASRAPPGASRELGVGVAVDGYAVVFDSSPLAK